MTKEPGFMARLTLALMSLGIVFLALAFVVWTWEILMGVFG